MALIDDIDAFLGRHHMAPTKFGREVLNDPAFVGNLRAGRRVFSDTEAKVRTFMDGYSSSSPTGAASTVASARRSSDTSRGDIPQERAA